MKVIKNYPPNYSDICEAIPGVRKIKTVVFTYGGCLYNPGGINISPDLFIHEETHVKQQTNSDEWWARYLVDVQFRLEQELEAYQAQYAFATKNYGRKHRRGLLQHIIKSLSGPMYGQLVNREDAKKLLTILNKFDTI